MSLRTSQPVKIGINSENLDEVVTDYLRQDGTLTEAETLQILDVEMEDGYAIFDGNLLKENYNAN